MLDIMKRIKEIDREHNGYVTSTELSDILQIAYPNLQNRNIKALFQNYSSIANKILIDYKRFRDDILKGIAKNKEKK